MTNPVPSEMINLNSDNALTTQGQIRVRDSDGVLVYHNGTEEVELSSTGDINTSGTILLMGAINGTGGIVVGGSVSNHGFTFSVVHTPNGRYDIALSAPSYPAAIKVVVENGTGINRFSQAEGYGGGGWPAPTGFRIMSVNDNGDGNDPLSFIVFTRY